jgi:hypothetical protein
MLKSWLALTICLAVFFPALAPSGIAHAASCKVAGGQSGALKYSGQVGTISAKVCGNEIWKLLPKPKTPVKKKPSKKPAKQVTWKNEFTVSPKAPGIQLSKQGSLQVGEPLDLTALAKVHTKNRLLLWYPAQVKFHPVGFYWNFADGVDSSSALVAHSWAKSGKYLVKLAVSYSVTYRIIGKSGWMPLPGLITVNATPLTIQVGGAALKKPRVVLVHWNCIQRIQAVGC